MRRWSALELIEISENGASLGPAGRGLLLLEAGGVARDAAAALPLGARDRRLFALRAAQFGPRMEVAQNCTACREALEFAFTAADLDRDRPASDAASSVEVGEATIRAVTAGDLAACERPGDAEAVREALRARVDPAGAVPDDARLDAILAELDPDAELAIAATCPECGHEQPIVFDVAAFFWGELELRVPRLLDDVAELARVFHWSERDILSMPVTRRHHYLAQVRG